MKKIDEAIRQLNQAKCRNKDMGLPCEECDKFVKSVKSLLKPKLGSKL